ncbi:hypothetical protein KY330_03035 [Candidatus Woesearchaeota archaeon]|nr:hypothetical protein [Candidatus Woesearchaeota archaeon]
MALFGPKTNEKEKTSGPPIDLVQQMKAQGFSDNQIVQSLQREGYKSHQIFDAMSQADMQNAGPVPPAPGMEEPGQQEYPEPASPAPQPEQYPSYQQYQTPYPSDDREHVEEVAESIIEEKWTDLMKTISRIIEWKDKIEKQITKVEHEIETLNNKFDDLHRGVLGRISEYDKSITSVGTDVKALEKVFSKILPTLTENVSELSKITSDIKKKKGK